MNGIFIFHFDEFSQRQIFEEKEQSFGRNLKSTLKHTFNTINQSCVAFIRPSVNIVLSFVKFHQDSDMLKKERNRETTARAIKRESSVDFPDCKNRLYFFLYLFCWVGTSPQETETETEKMFALHF